jgi:beta-galactosidase/beta-glucuronidase
VRATQQDGSYPRPMIVREQWAGLDGSWGFAHDDGDEGLAGRWFDPSVTDPFSRQITVPYPPESPASQIGDPGAHPIVWYRLAVPSASLSPGGAGSDQRVLVHFGAVDFRAQVWLNGRLVGSHVGGQTPFTVDVTEALTPEANQPQVLVVRAVDDPADLEQPRGKQDWRDTPHGIWYLRTTGIWQPVWTETVPRDHVVDVVWTPDAPAAALRGEITLSRRPLAGRLVLAVTVRLGEELLAEQSVLVQGPTTALEIGLDALRNGQDQTRLLWSPEHPTLLDIEIVLRERDSGQVIDTVAGYTGFRTVSVGGGSFQLNGQPYYLRSVLDQGYRPQTHLASTGSAQLRAEVEQILAMGFNTVRIHQKAEDPRFLHWADRLGLLVWAETAAAYSFSATAVELLVTEWMDLVRRDRSHPSVVVWVPVNESWGVQDIAVSAAQQNFVRSLAALTRALDPSRPVMSNEGWEHVDSDILGLHDYTTVAQELRARYESPAAAAAVVRSAHGPQGRRPIVGERQLARYLAGDAPLMLTEFGGISLSSENETWGYGNVGSASEYAALVGSLFDAVRASKDVVGYCYTQFMDTGQETNGLLFADGTAKLPIETIRRIVTGFDDGGGSGREPHSTLGWQD